MTTVTYFLPEVVRRGCEASGRLKPVWKTTTKIFCSANRAARNQPKVGDKRRDYLSKCTPTYVPRVPLPSPALPIPASALLIMIMKVGIKRQRWLCSIMALFVVKCLGSRELTIPDCRDTSQQTKCHLCTATFWHLIPTFIMPRAHNPYIDDRAEVRRSHDEDDLYEDDEDSSEAQIRLADEADFNMSGILADHDARVRSTAPYHIPAHFLQSGAETPARGKDWDSDTDTPPSRATSVMPTWVPPPPTGSRAPTPAYEPAESTSSEARWACTPLFLPDPESRGPTPFQPRDSRDFTPYVSPRNALAIANSAHPRPASSSPPPTAKRVRTASPPRDKARAQRLYKKLVMYLDTTAADSDEENNPQGGDEEDADELRDSDIAGISEDLWSEFIDDTPPQMDHLWRFDDDDDNDEPEALEAIAARFEKRAHDYSASAAREKRGAVAYVAPDDPALGLVVAQLSPSVNVRPALQNKTLRAMQRRLGPALPVENLPVVHGSWIRLNDDLVFVLGPKKVLMKRVDLPVPQLQPMDEEEDPRLLWKARKEEDTPDRYEVRQIAHTLQQKKYPAVQPTINELVPFRTSRCQALRSRPFAGPSQPLEAGDYVLIVGGERRGQTAYVLQIQELSANDQFKRVCQLIPHFPFHDTRDKSFPYSLNQILRHILSPSPPLHILDRVRVNFGSLYRGLSGRIRSIDGLEVTVALPLEAPFDEQLPSTLALDGSRTIEVPIENLNRYFLPGDHVVVVRGDRKNLHGLVIKTRDGREVLEDVAMGPGWTVKRHKTGRFNLVDFQEQPEEQAQTLRVMRADVDFVIFDAENATSAVFQQYTRTAVVDKPRGAALMPHINSSKAIEYRGAAQADDAEAYLAQQAGVVAATTKMVQLEPPATFAQLHSILQARDKATISLTSSLKQGDVKYANIYVQVAFRHRDKGFRGQVVASFDTKERSDRLRVQQTSQHRRRYPGGDTKGIMLTIKNEHNNQVSVPIENVIHDLTPLPLVQAQYLPSRGLYAPRLMTPSSPEPRPHTPTPLPQESDPQWGLESSAEEEQQRVAREQEQQRLQQRLAFKYEQQRLPGERDGTWLHTPGLVAKRVDVVIEGIMGFKPMKDIHQVFDKALRSQGENGVVILKALPNCEKQLEVFRIGQNQHKISFPPSCIKPVQERAGSLITKRVERVIVLGPDVEGNPSLIGSYAQTEPYIIHPHGDDVVAVRRADGSGPFYFHILRLCLSKNETIGVCKATEFPQYSQ
ncbi:hypothetical protein DFH09DRAFT_1109988 [Mycena vulgaris]|nr:hypothetical protein DFH09DRAFT_1109988 [Mycena vulgaris]